MLQADDESKFQLNTVLSDLYRKSPARNRTAYRMGSQATASIRKMERLGWLEYERQHLCIYLSIFIYKPWLVSEGDRKSVV